MIFLTSTIILKNDNVRSGVTFYVPIDYSTIQSAIDNANSGDKIVLMSGTYYENIVLKNDVLKKIIIKNIHIYLHI